jgi:hypothetical protein
MNPLEWSLVSEMSRHAHRLAHITVQTLNCDDGRNAVRLVENNNNNNYGEGRTVMLEDGMEILRFVQFAKVENPLRSYQYFNDDNLVGPFVRKFLFYHVELVYMFLLCRTVAIVSDSMIWSDLVPASRPLLPATGVVLLAALMIHFFMIQYGVYLVLTYYHRLGPQLTVSVPFFGPKKIISVGWIYLFLNVSLFSALYSFSLVDVLLIGQWCAFFYDFQQPSRKLFLLTTSHCDILWEGFCVGLVSVLLIQLCALYPILMTLLILLSWFAAANIYYHVNGFQLVFHFSGEKLFMSLVFFGLTTVSQLLWSSNSILSIVAFATIQSIFLPRALQAMHPGALKAYYGPFLASPTAQYLCSQFSRPALKARYFQFFFVYYCVRLVLLLYGRIV